MFLSLSLSLPFPLKPQNNKNMFVRTQLFNESKLSWLKGVYRCISPFVGRGPF